MEYQVSGGDYVYILLWEFIYKQYSTGYLTVSVTALVPIPATCSITTFMHPGMHPPPPWAWAVPIKEMRQINMLYDHLTGTTIFIEMKSYGNENMYCPHVLLQCFKYILMSSEQGVKWLDT